MCQFCPDMSETAAGVCGPGICHSLVALKEFLQNTSYGIQRLKRWSSVLNYTVAGSLKCTLSSFSIWKSLFLNFFFFNVIHSVMCCKFWMVMQVTNILGSLPAIMWYSIIPNTDCINRWHFSPYWAFSWVSGVSLNFFSVPSYFRKAKRKKSVPSIWPAGQVGKFRDGTLILQSYDIKKIKSSKVIKWTSDTEWNGQYT